jgi:hypothetical protein
MRYDGWDVILFSSNSAAPIQEFKTTCFEGLDDCELHCPLIPNSVPWTYWGGQLH